MPFDPTQPYIVTKHFTSPGGLGAYGNYSYEAGAIISDTVILAILGARAAPIAPVSVAVPDPTPNGSLLSMLPASLFEFRLPPGASVTYTIASTMPTSPPSQTTTISNPSGATSTLVQSVVNPAGASLYITATTGSPVFRIP